MPKKPARFTAVDFPTQFPAKSVADHQVYMSFNGDSDAAAFHDWWAERGAEQFQAWLNARED
jgi:hypothetical protein